MPCGCLARTVDAPRFQAASGEDARRVVRALLGAAQRRDARGVTESLCGNLDQEVNLRLEAMADAFSGMEAGRALPVWQGSVPAFQVELVPSSPARTAHQVVTVLAREGCVTLAPPGSTLSSPPKPAEATEPGEIAL